MAKTNVIFLQSDSMDGRVMGCMGHPAAHTPNFDALAARGVLFENAYCPSPQCVPSRAAMWSGKHVHSAECWNNYVGLDPDAPTFADSLAGAGYRVEILGRTDHLSGAHSLGNRLATWTRTVPMQATVKSPPECILVEDRKERVRDEDWERVDEAVRWIEENAALSEAPFFLHVGFTQPHPGSGFRTSPHYLEMINPDHVAVPAREEDPHPAMQYMQMTKRMSGRRFSDEEVRRYRRHYFAMVAELDAMVGEVVSAAERVGLLDSTMIIYTSDHGEMNFEHNQWLKNALYEPSVRVPLLFAGPGASGGREVAEPCSLVDLFPTFMDIAEREKPEWLEGNSLLSVLAGADAGEALPGWILCQYHSNMMNTGAYMIRKGPWKYIHYVGMPSQLFNVEEDPEELSDLSAKRPDVVGDLDALLRSILDPEEIDRKAKRLDRESFRAWRADVGEEEYRKTMGSLFHGWTDACFQKIDDWQAG